MSSDTTIVFGVPVPSIDPVFLAVVRFHIVVGVISVVTGVTAMLSQKGRGRHSRLGTIYYWSLSLVVLSATALFSGALGRELPTVFPRRAFLHRGNIWTYSFAARLAEPLQSAPRQHGTVIHSYADRILRRQWQAPPPVEGTTPVVFLGLAGRRRRSDHHLPDVEASSDASSSGRLIAHCERDGPAIRLLHSCCARG